MNKRLPLILSLVGVILLAVSLAYWILQLYQPPQRPLAAVPLAHQPDPAVDAAGTLFGGQVAVATATNYQLTGIVFAGRDSAAIIVADGAPPKALRVGKELAPGVTLSEVHDRYVMLSDGGVMKRIDLAQDTKTGLSLSGGGAPAGTAAGAPGAQPGSTAATSGIGGAWRGAAANTGPTPVATPPSLQGAPASAAPEPPMAPGAVAPQVQQQQQGFASPGDVGTHDNPPPANPNAAPANPNAVQMPAPARPQGPTQ